MPGVALGRQGAPYALRAPKTGEGPVEVPRRAWGAHRGGTDHRAGRGHPSRSDGIRSVRRSGWGGGHHLRLSLTSIETVPIMAAPLPA